MAQRAGGRPRWPRRRFFQPRIKRLNDLNAECTLPPHEQVPTQWPFSAAFSELSWSRIWIGHWNLHQVRVRQHDDRRRQIKARGVRTTKTRTYQRTDKGVIFD